MDVLKAVVQAWLKTLVQPCVYYECVVAEDLTLRLLVTRHLDNSWYSPRERFFAGKTVKVSRKLVLIPLLAFARYRRLLQADMLISHINLPETGQSGRPEWRNISGGTEVTLKLQLDESLQDTIKKFSRRRREKTRKQVRQGIYDVRLGHIANDLDFFYTQILEPHTRKRFGRFAKSDSREGLAKKFPNGFLLFLEQEGKTFAGALCEINEAEKELHYKRGGVLKGDPELMNRGLMEELYTAMISKGIELGLKSFHMGESFHLLSDGVLRFKLTYGATIFASESGQRIHLSIADNHKANAYVFERMGAVFTRPSGEPVGIAGCSQPEDTGLTALAKSLLVRGVNSCEIFHPDGSICISNEDLEKVA